MWYYSANGNQQGPIDEAAIAQLIANGTISAGSFIWKEGMPDWLPLNQSELASYLNPATGAPAQNEAPAAPQMMAQPQPYDSLQPGALGHQTLPKERTWMHTLFSFEGRIPRRTYWACIGIWIGLFFAVMFIAGFIGAMVKNESFAGILIVLLMIPYMWSVIALQVKRWHDRGKSGFMIFVNLIPLVGGIWAFVECGCLRGTEGNNEYGPDPT